MTAGPPDPMDDRATDSPPGVPKWVKLLALGAALTVAVLVMAMLFAGGDHGPGMHGG